MLTILSGQTNLSLTDFQKAMFRAGHAHAGVLVILSLVAQLLADYAYLPEPLVLPVRIGFPLAAILVSGGFFASAAGPGTTQSNAFIWILYTGALILALSVIALGIGLLRK